MEITVDTPEELTAALTNLVESKATGTVVLAVSRQRKHGGGKFKSEDQRRYMWSQCPRAAKKWANNRKTRPSDWRGCKIQTRPGI